MKRVVIDRHLASRDAIFDALADALGFPARWGRNLDALYDVLRTDVAGPVEIVWRAARGRERDAILAVLREVARERSDVTLTISDSPPPTADRRDPPSGEGRVGAAPQESRRKIGEGSPRSDPHPALPRKRGRGKK